MADRLLDLANSIRSKWQDTVKGIFDVALMLEAAREELGASAWLKMVTEELGWSKQTGYKLMELAKSNKFVEVAHVRLPAAWGTLYELSQLTDEQFASGLETGVIHPGMQRKDIAKLKPPTSPASPSGRRHHR